MCRAAQFLDADDNQLVCNATNRSAARDIVQFVPFRQFRGDLAALARSTLAEVPEQVTGYMAARGITPNPPRQAVAVVAPSATKSRLVAGAGAVKCYAAQQIERAGKLIIIRPLGLFLFGDSAGTAAVATTRII